MSSHDCSDRSSELRYKMRLVEELATLINRKSVFNAFASEATAAKLPVADVIHFLEKDPLARADGVDIHFMEAIVNHMFNFNPKAPNRVGKFNSMLFPYSRYKP